MCFGGSCCILGGAISLTGHFPGAQKCFFFFLYSFFFVSHHQHSTMIMLERSWPALLSFFSFYYYSFSLSLVCLPVLSGTIGNFIWRSPASGSAGLVRPFACPLATRASRHTDSAAPWSGLVWSGYRVMPPWTLPQASVGVDGGLGLGKGLLFFLPLSYGYHLA